jgi:hypothetical protein
VAKEKPSDLFFQSWWRRIGIGAITIAALMAVASVPTDVLHDTVVHVVRMSGGEIPEDVTYSTPAFVCGIYWMVFLGALLTALYMAMLDMRFIRLNYALERHVLFRQALGDDLSESLVKRMKRPDSKN